MDYENLTMALAHHVLEAWRVFPATPVAVNKLGRAAFHTEGTLLPRACLRAVIRGGGGGGGAGDSEVEGYSRPGCEGSVSFLSEVPLPSVITCLRRRSDPG